EEPAVGCLRQPLRLRPRRLPRPRRRQLPGRRPHARVSEQEGREDLLRPPDVPGHGDQVVSQPGLRRQGRPLRGRDGQGGAGDGRLDVYVTPPAIETSTLWKQGPERGAFADRTERCGLLRTDWRGTGWGTLLADFDQDGWPDIAVVNGAVNQGTSTPNPALG